MYAKTKELGPIGEGVRLARPPPPLDPPMNTKLESQLRQVDNFSYHILIGLWIFHWITNKTKYRIVLFRGPLDQTVGPSVSFSIKTDHSVVVFVIGDLGGVSDQYGPFSQRCPIRVM